MFEFKDKYLYRRETAYKWPQARLRSCFAKHGPIPYAAAGELVLKTANPNSMQRGRAQGALGQAGGFDRV
jgi:hypothetical protein